MHEIEHGEAPVRLGSVLGREIDIAGTLRAGQFGVVLLDTDLAMRDLLLEVEIDAGLRHLDTAGPVSRAEELLGVRIGHPLAVNVEHIVVESRHEGVGGHFPHAVLALRHLIGLADIDRYGLGIRSLYTENDAEVRIDLGILLSREIGCGGSGLREDTNLLVSRAGNGNDGHDGRDNREENAMFHYCLLKWL